MSRVPPHDFKRERGFLRKALQFEGWVLAIIILLGAALRLDGLGEKSLWLDEFATWHVSRLPLFESLFWSPELTKPPLYQMLLRVAAPGEHPSEFMLRLPAAIFGTATIVAGWFIGRRAAGPIVGLALGGLVAIQSAQLESSQTARPNSMLVLGCAMSSLFFLRLLNTASKRDALFYIIASALSFHAHYLTALTIAAHGAWLIVGFIRGDRRSLRIPILTLVTSGILCLPMALHYLRLNDSVFQGLDWISPATWRSGLQVLSGITFGSAWFLSLPASVIILAVTARRRKKSEKQAEFSGFHWMWLFVSWGGLWLISILAQPAMIERYALPASIPALLIPLLAANRLDRRAPLLVLAVTAVASAPSLIVRHSDVQPGFRELVAFLQETVDPQREVVVLAIDGTVDEQWADMERLCFRYYPLKNIPVVELAVSGAAAALEQSILRDPRALKIVVFRADPVPLMTAAGRTSMPPELEGRRFDQLLFSPYRLLQFAPTLDALGPFCQPES